MAINRHSEPPDFREDPDGFMDWARSLHDGTYGINEAGGTLDGKNNIVTMDNPGTADETVAGNAAVINALVDSMIDKGLVEE
jgi:hypothetical protein